MLQDLLPLVFAYLYRYTGLELAIIIIIIFLYSFGEVRRWILENAKDRREELQQRAEDRRNGQIFAMQRIRLTETNLRTKDRMRVIDAKSATPIVSYDLQLANIGDGPIDILCALMSARMLDSDKHPGIGTRARNVEWTDHRSFYWNDRDASGIFSGISTTKSMIAAADQYLRLAPGGRGILRRKDAIRGAQITQAGVDTDLKYQGFIVARGYPLGEIWRQLGGRPPDLIESLDLARLQFRALARPNLYRWRCVQEALLNLNRLAFRLALEGGAYATTYDALIKSGATQEAAQQQAETAAIAASADPLGLLTSPDAWRFFLLRHMEFVNMGGPEPTPEDLPSVNITALMEQTTQHLKQQYLADLVVPDTFATDPLMSKRYADAREFCYNTLRDVVASWTSLATVIKESAEYRIKGYDGCFAPIPVNQRKAYEKQPDDGYPVRIHTDKFYRDRWLYYLEEGYLISKPFPRQDKGINEYDEQDIPDDPRDLEPFVIHQMSSDVTIRL